MAHTATVLRKRDENPAWFNIFEHSWAKVTMWGRRVAGKWNYGIEQAILCGQVPSVKSVAGSSQFRDTGCELEVFQMAQAMEFFKEYFQKTLGEERFQVLQTMWLTGRLDSKIAPPVAARRKDFQPRDFVFVALEAQEGMPTDFLNMAGVAEKQSLLQKLHSSLLQEQRAWRSHLAKVKCFEDCALGDFNSQVAKQQDKLEEAWASHKRHWFHTHTALDCSVRPMVCLG